LSRKRTAMRKIDEILRLHLECGMGIRQIARSCKLSHSKVSEYLEQFACSGKSWPLAEGEIFIVKGNAAAAEALPLSLRKPLPDWSVIHEELKHKGITLQLLWQEHRKEHANGYGYSQFCELYKKWRKKLSPSMRQYHKAGEKMFVDYAGPKMSYYDNNRGEQRAASIFVAVLGASSYTYAEAQSGETKRNWIMGHVRAFDYFAGVPDQVIPDNLKTGVTSPCYYEPTINPDYLDLSRHYHTVIIPARVRKPKDKAKVEVAVQVVERWIMAALRKRIFLSLEELNQAIRELLEVLNTKVMKHLGKSRRELWEHLEKGCLKPLPQKRYEYGEWRTAMVGIDYHVRVEKNWYSVPWRLVHQSVDVRIGEHVIEIFQRGQAVTSHPRSMGENEALTKKEHMPEGYRAMAAWTPERFLRWAEKIGGSTRELISRILSTREYPEQSFRKCLGIIKQADRYGSDRLEAACRRALHYRIFSYRGIKEILENNYDRLELLGEKREEPPCLHENIRGGGYYGKGEIEC
jgi:transposase